MALAIAPPKHARTALSRTARESSEDDTGFSTTQGDIFKVLYALNGRNDARQDKPRSAKVETIAHLSGVKAAATTIHQVSIPEEHGLPFLKKRADPEKEKDALLEGFAIP